MGKGAGRALILTALLSACAGTEAPNSSEGIYRKDLLIKESDKVIYGLGVLPKKKAYNLEIRAREKAELVRFSNCHRDFIDTKKRGWDEYSYYFEPNPSIEKGSCVLQITFLDAKGYHQFGAVSFVDDETLPARLACNGEKKDRAGASTCQAKVGTLQTITFKDSTQVKSTCAKPKTKDSKLWTYAIEQGFCLFLFRSKAGEFHKLTTFGYEDIAK